MTKENRHSLKLFLIVLLVALLACSLFLSACGRNENSNVSGSDSDASSGSESGESSGDEGTNAKWSFDIEADAATVKPGKRTEVVSVNADASGKVEKIVSTVTLSEIEGSDTIEDTSTLKGIKNKKGDEEFKQKDGKLYWENKGETIEYEGTASGDLPVGISIKYELDGDEIEPRKLAGKSGKLKIRIDYSNTARKDVTVKGTPYNMKVPFAALTAMFFPEGVLTNVRLDNCKLTSISSQDVIIGAGFPGLSDSLKAKDNEVLKDMDIPEYIEITADVKDFEMDFSTTIFQNGIFSEDSNKMSGEIDDMVDSMGDLREGVDKLVDGANSLLSGHVQLNNGVYQYLSAIDQFNQGLYAIADGAFQLNSQTQTLIDGAYNLSVGTSQLRDYVGQMEGMLPSTLDSNERQQIVSMLRGLKTEMDTLANGSSTLYSGINSYGSGVNQISESIVQLQNGMNQLAAQNGTITNGMNSVQSGIEEFRNGLTEFKNDGISELTDFVEKDLADLNNRINGLKSIDSKYNSYSGSDDSVESSVLYMIETKGIGK